MDILETLIIKILSQLIFEQKREAPLLHRKELYYYHYLYFLQIFLNSKQTTKQKYHLS